MAIFISAIGLLHLCARMASVLIILCFGGKNNPKLSLEWKNICRDGGILRAFEAASARSIKAFLQVIQFQSKMKGILLIFGRELKPSDAMGFSADCRCFDCFDSAFVFIKIKNFRLKPPKWMAKFYSAFSLNIFALIAQFMMRRSYDLMNGFEFYNRFDGYSIFCILGKPEKIRPDYI